MQIKLDVNGATLLVEERGVDQGRPALVFLHYWGGSAATWRKVVAGLEGETRCVLLNQRGWGGSKATDGRYDLATMAEDVRSVAEGAGLKWQWRKVQGKVMDEGNWEGDCDKVRS